MLCAYVGVTGDIKGTHNHPPPVSTVVAPDRFMDSLRSRPEDNQRAVTFCETRFVKRHDTLLVLLVFLEQYGVSIIEALQNDCCRVEVQKSS